MLRQRRSHSYGFIVLILFTIVLALTFSCSEQPTTVRGELDDTGGFTGTGEIDPGSGDSFLIGTVSDTTFAPGHIAVWAMDLAYDDTVGIVSFDVVLMNQTERPIPAPIHFVITWIRPATITVVEFDGVSEEGFPYYDFSGKLGPDNILEPGEQSDRVTMKFHTVEARSFGIGFRIDLGLPHGTGKIVGVVFRDDNRNGVRDRSDRGEPGIPGITVSMEKPPLEFIAITRTDTNGVYSFSGLDAGVYTITVHAPPDRWEVTSPNPLLVTLVEGPDGDVKDFYGADFGLFPKGISSERTLFGPILIGPASNFGALLDTTFVDPISMLPIVFTYYLQVAPPPIMVPWPIVIDSAAVWINDEQVFSFNSEMPPDTIFVPQLIELEYGVVQTGENDIRLYTDGNEYAMLYFRVFRRPF